MFLWTIFAVGCAGSAYLLYRGLDIILGSNTGQQIVQYALYLILVLINTLMLLKYASDPESTIAGIWLLLSVAVIGISIFDVIHSEESLISGKSGNS